MPTLADISDISVWEYKQDYNPRALLSITSLNAFFPSLKSSEDTVVISSGLQRQTKWTKEVLTTSYDTIS